MRPLIIILSLLSQSCFADWTLVNYASNLNYYSIRKTSTEVNAFTNMEGAISNQGYLNIRIDLSSIETNNSKRNLLIQDVFLETRNFNEGTISISLGNDFLKVLDINKSTEITVMGTLMFHGAVQNVNMVLSLTRLKNDFLLVNTYEPIVLQLENFDLAQGLKKLKREKSFETVTNQVPITFNMFFKQSSQ